MGGGDMCCSARSKDGKGVSSTKARAGMERRRSARGSMQGQCTIT
jgi:hypothetical protein